MEFQNKLIFNKYRVKSFNELSNLCWTYYGENIKNNEPVFMKIEKKNLKYNFLESEAYCLINLKGFGIPRIISYGKVGKYNILVEELLGKSLHELWKLRNIKEKLNIKNVCMVALQALDRLEYIHSKNYIHRDIKPQNFVNGRKDPNIIYIIDFGFSHQYKSSRTGKHIKFKSKNLTMGSLSYLSINVNIGYEASRRDDLESLGYMLIFLANEDLPWLRIEDLNISKIIKFKKIYNLKKTTSVEKLCEGLPEEFAKYINYTRKLDFEEDPDYDYLRSLFSSILVKNQEKNDLNFFWNNNEKIEEKKSVNLNNIHQRKDGSKNRLFKKIKSSLEKSENQRKTIQHNNLRLEHVNDINFKPIYQKKYYSNADINRNDANIKNIIHDEPIINRNVMNISYNNNKFNFNFGNTINKNSENIKNIDIKFLPININKSIFDINPNNLYNSEICTNINRSLEQKRKSFLVNKYFNTDNKFFNQNKNKNKNEANKELFLNCNNNQNVISKKIKNNKKILIRRNNKYRTLYEREKEKEKNICNEMNRPSLNYLLRNYESFNQLNKKNNSTKRQISLKNRTLNFKDMIGNASQGIIIKNNFCNNTMNNSRFYKNVKISNSTNSIKKNLFISNIKKLQIKRCNLLNNDNSDQNFWYKNSSKEYNNSYNSYKGNPKNIKLQFLKENKNYNQYKININSSINNLNDLYFSDNNIPYRNIYSLNCNSFNKDNKISLTEQDGNIKFMNIFENNFRNIHKNGKNSFMFKNNKNICS